MARKRLKKEQAKEIRDKMPKKKIDESMTLMSHFEELRKRLIISLIVIVACAVGIYAFVPKVLDHIAKPVGKLVFISPVEAFWVQMKIAFFLGIYIALPIVFYQIWRFVEIGLRSNEKRHILPFTIISFLLFTSGAMFCYFFVVPIGMKFLLAYATETLIPMISVSRYVSFLIVLLFSFGIVFELPLVISFLTKIGMVSPKGLQEKRKFVILGIFVIAAALTPGPDVFSQFLMAIPLLILYEVSIWISKAMSRRKNKPEIVTKEREVI